MDLVISVYYLNDIPAVSKTHLNCYCNYTYFTFFLCVRNTVTTTSYIDVLENISLWHDAGITRLDVGTLCLIHHAACGIICKYSNVPPGGWMPVWVIVSLFWTLIATTITTLILTCKPGIVPVNKVLHI